VGSTAILLDVRDVGMVEEGIRANSGAKGKILALDLCFLCNGIGEGVGEEGKFINDSIFCFSWDWLSHLDMLKVLYNRRYIFNR